MFQMTTPSKKRRIISLEDKKKIIARVDEKKWYADIGAEFGSLSSSCSSGCYGKQGRSKSICFKRYIFFVGRGMLSNRKRCQNASERPALSITNR